MGEKNTVFAVAWSHSILHCDVIFYFQVDWFTGYSEIMTEHYWVNEAAHYELSEYF